MSSSRTHNMEVVSLNTRDVLDNMRRLNWTATPNLRVASRFAAPAPGVYAIGGVHRLAGLPRSIEWLYIGRSTAGGLRGRLRSHRPQYEANPQLRKWLAQHHEEAEVWFALTVSAEEAIELEKRLIYQLNPRFNTIGTRKEHTHER